MPGPGRNAEAARRRREAIKAAAEERSDWSAERLADFLGVSDALVEQATEAERGGGGPRRFDTALEILRAEPSLPLVEVARRASCSPQTARRAKAALRERPDNPESDAQTVQSSDSRQ